MENLKLNSNQINILKYIAIFLMLIDHIYFILLDESVEVLHLIGRLAFPIFAFVLAYNYINNTKNKTKYINRLLIFAFLSQPFYYYAFDFTKLNIFFTLAFGLIIINIYEQYTLKKHYTVVKANLLIIAMLGLIMPLAMYFDYNIIGIILVICCYSYLKEPTLLTFINVIFVLLLLNFNGFDSIYMCIATLFSLALLKLITYIDIKCLALNKWFFFAFYPMHLMVLKIISIL